MRGLLIIAGLIAILGELTWVYADSGIAIACVLAIVWLISLAIRRILGLAGHANEAPEPHRNPLDKLPG